MLLIRRKRSTPIQSILSIPVYQPKRANSPRQGDHHSPHPSKLTNLKRYKQSDRQVLDRMCKTTIGQCFVVQRNGRAQHRSLILSLLGMISCIQPLRHSRNCHTGSRKKGERCEDCWKKPRDHFCRHTQIILRNFSSKVSIRTGISWSMKYKAEHDCKNLQSLQVKLNQSQQPFQPHPA